MRIPAEVRVGILAILSVGLGYVGFLYLSGKNLFSSEKIYYVRLPKAEGLEKARPVIVQGFPVGEVQALELVFDTLFIVDTQGNCRIDLQPWVRVTIRVEDRIQIPVGTRVRLVSTSILGERALELLLAENDSILPPGSLIQGEISPGIEEMVRQEILPVKVKAEELLAQLDTLVTTVQFFFTGIHKERLTRSIYHLDQTLRAAAVAAQTLQDIAQENRLIIKSTLTHLDQLSETLAGHRRQLAQSIDYLAEFTDSLRKIQLTAALKNLQQTLIQLDTILRSVASGKGTAGLLLTDDSVYWHLNASLHHLSILLKDIHDRPYRYVHVSLVGPSPKKIERWERRQAKRAARQARKQSRKQTSAHSQKSP